MLVFERCASLHPNALVAHTSSAENIPHLTVGLEGAPTLALSWGCGSRPIAIRFHPKQKEFS